MTNSTSHANHRRLRSALAGTLIALAVLLAGGEALADPASPLTVTKTASSNPVASGQQLTYTIQVTNTGGAKVDNVVLTDQVNGVGVIQNPPALPQLIMTSTKGSCSLGGPNGNVVTCPAGSMAGGETWTVTIRGQVTAGNGTTLNNTASVTATKSAQTFTTSGSVSTLVSGGTGAPLADLTINKTGPTSVAPGASMTYTLTVNNLGTANASNVKVVDTLPAGVALVSATGTSLFVCTPAGPTASPVTVTCTGGAVNQGQNATITINATAPASGPLTNTAVVDPDNTIVEGNELNNTSAAVNTTVGGPPPAPLLSIFKTDGNPDLGVPWDEGAGPDPVNPGQLITYKIQVTNNATGPNSRADDVVVTDTHQGLDAASITASQVIVNGAVGTNGGCVVNAPEIRCSIRSLDSGGTQTITVTGTVQQSAGSSIFNTATVNGNIKNTGVTNTASEVTTVRPAVDLTITKSDSPDPVCARSWPTPGHLASPPFLLSPAGGLVPALLQPAVCLGGLTYTFVVGNSGIATASGVTVRDPLPAGLIFDSYDTNGGFVCGVDLANVVTCTGGMIPPASTRTITLLLVAPDSLGTITNSVTVDPNNAIFEPDETNNDATTTTNVVTGIDLVVWKSDKKFVDPPGDGAPLLSEGFDPIATSGTGTYTIIVDNVGTQDATGIKVRDTLPAGTQFLSVTSDNGFTCSFNSGQVTCISGHLLGTESEFYDPAGPDDLLPAPGDDFATITIKFFATPFVQLGPPMALMHNEVRVDPDNEIAEVNELNNLATDDTVVTVGNDDKGAFNQLKITKTQVDPSVAAGDLNATVATNGTLIYNLHVENLGTDPVSAVVVKDFLPTGSRFISAKDTDPGPTNASDAFFCIHDGSPTGGVITCTGGALSGSLNKIPEDTFGDIPTSRDIVITVFAPNIPGPAVNLAKVDPDNIIPEGNEFDNASQITTTVAVGGNNMFNELTITKAQTTTNPVATSSIVTYTIVVSNTGSDPAFNVRFTDTLPAGFTFISALDLAGPGDPFKFVCVPAAGNTVECTGATLSGLINAVPGQPTSRTIELKAFSSAVPGTYTNTVIVDPANAIPEGNETNNTANATTAVAVGGNNMFNDLTISKTQIDPVGAVATSSIVTYSIVVTNAGTDPAFNVRLTDILPAGFTFISALDTSPPSDPFKFVCVPAAGNTVECTGATLSGTDNAAGANPTSRTIVLKAFSSAVPGNYTNTVIVDPANAIAEGNETNNSAQAPTLVQVGAPQGFVDLMSSKAGPGNVRPGDTITYTLTVTNAGTDPAFNVKVRDDLPDHTTFVSAVDTTVEGAGAFSCSLVGASILCTGGALDGMADVIAGVPVTRTIEIKVLAPTSIEEFAANKSDVFLDVFNRAFVDPDNTISESNETNNASNLVKTTVKSAINLTLTKQGPGSATQNDTITYTITVKNVKVGDGATAFDVKIVDALPVGLIPLSITAEPGNFICALTENPVNSVTCLGDLETNESVVITIKAFVTQDGGTLDNEACVDPDSDIAETNELDNCKHSIGQVLPPAPDLSINKTASTGSVTSGEELVYTLTVSNVGTGPTTGSINVLDTVPSDVTVTNINPDGGWDCSASSGNLVDCTRSDLASGESSNIVVTTTAGATLTSPFTNTATVSGGGDVQLNNNSDSVTTSVGGAAIDLTVVSITDEPDPVNRGSQLTYTIIARNDGTSGAPNAIVRVELPDMGTTTQGVAGTNGFNCSPIADPTGDTYDCVGDFAASGSPGDSTEITAIVTVNADAPNDLKVTVTVDPDNAFGESNETNNTLSDTTTVTGTVCTSSPCVDLVVADVFDSPDPVTTPGEFSYVATIVNVGDSPVDPTAIWKIHFQYFGTGTPLLTIPAGVSCAPILIPPGLHHVECTSTGGTDGMDLGPGEGLVFTVTVTGATAGTSSLNVQVDETGAITEFSESNNSVTETTTIVDP